MWVDGNWRLTLIINTSLLLIRDKTAGCSKKIYILAQFTMFTSASVSILYSKTSQNRKIWMNFYFCCTNFLINSYQSHIWLRFFKCVYKTFFLEFSTSSLISGKNLASLDVLWVKSCTAFSISFLQKAVIQYFLLLLLSCEKGSVHFLADRTVVTSVKICVWCFQLSRKCKMSSFVTIWRVCNTGHFQEIWVKSDCFLNILLG